jgi:phosphonate transport system substrate-binding protein
MEQWNRASALARRTVARCASLLMVGVALTLLAACMPGGAAPSGSEAPATLRVGIIPNIAPDDQRAKYDPLREYLQDTLGVEVELFVATNYAGVVTALTSEKIDVAYLGGLTYVQAEQQSPIEPLVTEVDRETGTKLYQAAIVVRNDSPIRTVPELVAAGGTFAFGDVSSTSGSLYPRIMLVEAGAQCSSGSIESCPPLAKTTFTGGHDATAKAVAAGSVTAGGLELRILHRLEKDGSVEPGALRVIGTKDVIGYPWVARSALGPATLDKVRQAFLAIDDPVLLDLLRAKRYEAVTATDYDEVRQQAEQLGLLSK